MNQSLKIISAIVFIVATCNSAVFASFTITFDGYNHGDYVDGLTLNGVATVTSTGPNAGSRIFNSDLSGTADPDLEVGLGNILMLQNNLNLGAVDDDADGGLFTFDFVSPVSLTSMDLVDIDDGVTVDVMLTDTALNTRSYHVPSNWTYQINTDGPNGYDTLDLTTLLGQLGEGGAIAGPPTLGAFDVSNIQQMTVAFTGSGALDNIVGTATVPAPGALLLGAVGSSAVGLLRRRRTL